MINQGAILGGVRWAAGANYSRQLIQVVTTTMLARLLVPADFGLVAMAQVFVGLAGTLATGGLSQAIVQRDTIEDGLLETICTAGIIAGTALTILLWLLSPLASTVYSNPEVRPVMAALSPVFLLGSAGLVPDALLNRELKFRQLAVVDLSCASISGVCSVGLAVSGFGVWSLVWPSVFAAAMRSLLLVRAAGWRFRLRFHQEKLRSVLAFGLHVTGFNVFNYFVRQADNLLIGAMLGPTSLGYYSVAYTLMLKPREIVTNVLVRVLFPTLSRIPTDDARFRAVYLRACGGIAFVTFPVMTGLGCAADPLIRTFLGEGWQPAAKLLQVLAVTGAIQSIWSTVGQIYLARGRADLQLRYGGGFGVLFVISYLIGVPWGVYGVAVSYSLANIVLFAPAVRLAFQLIDGLTVGDLARQVRGFAVACGAMAVMLETTRWGLGQIQLSAPLELVALVIVGVVAYGAIMAIYKPRALGDLLALLRIPGTRTFGAQIDESE